MRLRVPRALLFAVALAAGGLAAAMYYSATRQADVVVMATDIAEPRPLNADDLAVRTVAAELAPEDALRRIDDAIGLTPRAPLLRGQIVMATAVAADIIEFRGWSLDPGMRAVALPVRVIDALGGAIVPGARVDVLALPIPGRAPTGRTAEVLITSAAVLDVRGESGAAYVPRETKMSIAIDHIASVVIAIAAADEARFADRLATSTFVLALVGEP